MFIFCGIFYTSMSYDYLLQNSMAVVCELLGRHLPRESKFDVPQVDMLTSWHGKALHITGTLWAESTGQIHQHISYITKIMDTDGLAMQSANALANVILDQLSRYILDSIPECIIVHSPWGWGVLAGAGDGGGVGLGVGGGGNFNSLSHVTYVQTLCTN